MVYKILVSQRTQVEIENAIDYYTLHSADAPKEFIASLQDSYGILATNPFQRLRYKTIRAIRLHKFPFSLYFTINKNKKTIKVLACFHNKRNPEKRP